jgi:hypothetical protein
MRLRLNPKFLRDGVVFEDSRAEREGLGGAPKTEAKCPNRVHRPDRHRAIIIGAATILHLDDATSIPQDIACIGRYSKGYSLLSVM